ncbi:Gfo/Idh/MocA family oxidoreductase [Inquilinus sp. CAU 1745]|uniref:Gfo/Idh/MocA family protein n=1 Tax=Inquilinus sp. CAU 1745 TaxID=3140369 RepID=UPI00325BDCBE
MIGVGILGAGHFGAVHARAIAVTKGVRVTAVCRENGPAAAAFAAEHGGVPYTDWRRMLEDASVDVVVIATPHHLHREMAVAAAEAGKHILLEKPMAPTTADCDVINAAVAKAGVVLMIGHIMHFALPCLKARDILEAGDLGRPLVGSSWLIKLWMEENRRPWHLSPDTGGGMLMTAGIHALDRLIWLMGSMPEAVSAVSGSLFHEQAADDTALMMLRFADGGLGQVASIGYRNGAPSFAMDLVCEGGVIRVDFDSGVHIGRGTSWTPVPESIEPDWMDRAVAREWVTMAAAIRGEAPVAVTGAYGRGVIACIEAARRAAEERYEIPLGDGTPET